MDHTEGPAGEREQKNELNAESSSSLETWTKTNTSLEVEKRNEDAKLHTAFALLGRRPRPRPRPRLLSCVLRLCSIFVCPRDEHAETPSTVPAECLGATLQFHGQSGDAAVDGQNQNRSQDCHEGQRDVEVGQDLCGLQERHAKGILTGGRLNVLRALISETNNSVKTPSPIQTDLQLLSLIRKRATASQQAALEFEKADRPDLKENEDVQVAILEEYASQVETMGTDEIQTIVSQEINKLKDAGSKVDSGSLMKVLFAPGGPIDGKPAERSEVAKIAKEAIAAA